MRYFFKESFLIATQKLTLCMTPLTSFAFFQTGDMGLDMGGQADPLAYRQDGEFFNLVQKLAFSFCFQSLFILKGFFLV